MAQATYDDANLLLRLYELRREEKLRRARAWFVSSFRVSTMEELGEHCPPGSEQSTSMRMVVSYWDMVASFITAGVLNEELFFQSNRELLLVWENVRPLIAELREQRKDPTVWANLEKVAQSYIKWIDRQSPGTYEAWIGFVRSSAGEQKKGD